MKKFRALSLLLSLSLLTSLAIPGTMALPISVVGEQQDNEQQNNEQQNNEQQNNEQQNNGMVISKTAKANDDGSYTITLEAYATGDKIITETTKDIPTDIVLVLDQSGSMDYRMSSNFMKYDNQSSDSDLYEKRFNQKKESNKNLYYRVGDGYVQVMVDNGKNWWGNYYNYYYMNGQKAIHIETSYDNDPVQTYYYLPDTSTRLDALKSAVTNFSESVATKAMGADGVIGSEDDVNHRIAVVGFASGDWYNHINDDYKNTEIFVGAQQYKYGDGAKNVYKTAFQDMRTEEGKKNVLDSIGALTADGGTLTQLGVELANGILEANPVTEGQQRNRVIIVFTDGVPGWSGYDSNVAYAAISEAQEAKDNKITVYSIGIFSGADATSRGNQDGSEAEKANWFMQKLSSNNGTPQNPSYYLSASDSETLNSIFQKISDQIETGGSSTTLNENTVIRDIIAPEFTLPEGTTADKITLEIYSYEGENQWEKNDTTNINATASIDGDRVDVTGFDFAKNYVGTVTKNGVVTDYRGNKLVISFTVEPKTGFLGGNNVYTNTGAGIYENATSKEPVLTFNRPQVNVPIKNVNVTAEDKNVYLLNGLTASDLRCDATAKVGDVYLSLDPKKGNYGLETWQTSGVDISVVIKDAGGNVVNDDLTGLRDDTTYTVEIQVSPKETALSASDGDAATTKYGTATANINVFKPELTYQDSKVYYGAGVPTNFTGNLFATTWKHHGKTVADTTTMPNVPKLTIEYTVDATKVNQQGKINSKQDIGVDTLIRIDGTDVTGDTTFLHKACEPACGWENPITGGTPAFLLHVQTCQLTVSKTDGAEDEPYVFTVYKYDEDNKEYIEYSEITIVGNNSETIFELPVGTYTIEEDTDWSWRYAANNGGSACLTADASTGSITCTNEKTKDYWLNGFSNVLENIFGKAK